MMTRHGRDANSSREKQIRRDQTRLDPALDLRLIAHATLPAAMRDAALEWLDRAVKALEKEKDQ